jgi:TPP-dependent pyruvate/acetoin dehydrogenase alpha subunit
MAPSRRLQLYRHLRRVRLLDERLVQLQRQGRIGFHGSCAGQEVAPVAAGLALRESDWIFPALRESYVMLVRGFPLARYLAQDFASSLDVAKGRQMPSHQSARAVNVCRGRAVSLRSCPKPWAWRSPRARLAAATSPWRSWAMARLVTQIFTRL